MVKTDLEHIRITLKKMVEDVINAVAGSVDFSQYDNDHDGYVDALFVIHTGQGAEFTGSSSDIWSHAWTTYTPLLHKWSLYFPLFDGTGILGNAGRYDMWCVLS